MSKEIRDILSALRLERGRPCALATVVRAEGSSYRKTGARMLVTSTGGIAAGCVSGGCLEADVVERACAVIESGIAVVARYDTRFDESEIVFGWGTGCSGLIEVLIEPIDLGNVSLMLPEIADERRQDFVLMTFYGPDVPERVLIDVDGRIAGGHRTALVSTELIALAQETIRSERSQTANLPGTSVSVCLEYLAPIRSLIIYGSGPDAGALADLARHVGWSVTVADHRAVSPERFPADRCVTCHPELLADHVVMDRQTALVIMSHNYMVDRELLCSLAESPLRYIGLLGSRSRALRLREDLESSEDRKTLDRLAGKLHAPIGLDIGASTPQMIALSIVAEIEAIYSKPVSQSLCSTQSA